MDIAQLEEHVRFVPSGDIGGGFTHLIVRDKGERCVELTLRQSRGLQGRRDDRPGVTRGVAPSGAGGTSGTGRPAALKAAAIAALGSSG